MMTDAIEVLNCLAKRGHKATLLKLEEFCLPCVIYLGQRISKGNLLEYLPIRIQAKQNIPLL